jgi:hypothetical protein
VFVWARVVHTLTERIVPRPPIGEPQAVVWDTRVFTTDRQLKAFLDAKGISYAEWVSRHPAAFALLRHELPASAVGGTPATHRPTTKRKPPAAKAASGAPSATQTSTAVEPRLLTGIFVALGLALAASAALPLAIAPRSLRRLYRVPERRAIALAAAAALLVGALLAALNL